MVGFDEPITSEVRHADTVVRDVLSQGVPTATR